MGSHNSKNKPQLVHSKQVDVAVEHTQAEPDVSEPKKVAFIGAGATGKSTFLRCAHQICGTQLSDAERQHYVPIFYSNAVTNMRTILQSSNLNSKILGPSFDVVQNDGGGNLETVKHVLNLWDNPLVRQAAKEPDYLKRRTGVEEQLFGLLPEMAQEGWLPTDEQLLLVRMRTTGIVESTMNVGNAVIRTFDVGGQREERKKWIHIFDGLVGVAFFTAPGAFEEALFEDETVNKLQEDFELYQDIAKSRWFVGKHFICILNKMDRFPSEPPLTLSQLKQACPFLVDSLLGVIVEFTGVHMTPEQILSLETSLQGKMDEGETAYDFVHRRFRSVRADVRVIDCVAIDRNSVENALEIMGEIVQHPCPSVN